MRRNDWLIGLALLLVAIAGWLAWRLAADAPATRVAIESEPARTTAVAPAETPPAPPGAPAERRAFTVQRREPEPAEPPATTEAPPAVPPPLPEFPPDPPDGPVGGPSGIAAFPPLGTDPPKAGLLVPDDFELPEGYVRHYQATDDGELLPPILMFHPDYEFFDPNGQPIELPEDLIVPPELAPPGLEPEVIELPPPAPDEPENPVP
jgi:hypothetical protein